MYFCFPSNQYLSFHYPFRDPSITPWLKYFWTKGYIHIMGAEDTTITAYLIRSAICLASTAAAPVVMALIFWLLISMFLNTSCRGCSSGLRR